MDGITKRYNYLIIWVMANGRLKLVRCELNLTQGYKCDLALCNFWLPILRRMNLFSFINFKMTLPNLVYFTSAYAYFRGVDFNHFLSLTCHYAIRTHEMNAFVCSFQVQGKNRRLKFK